MSDVTAKMARLMRVTESKVPDRCFICASGSFRTAHRRTASDQRPGIRESRLIRVRTSSPRFVSCVEDASIVCGQSLSMR